MKDKSLICLDHIFFIENVHQWNQTKVKYLIICSVGEFLTTRGDD